MAVQTAVMKEKAPEVEQYTGFPVKLSRRPERNTVIGREDILNLRIALETSRSLEEFLSRV